MTPEEYLCELASGLPGPRSARRRLLAELRDHLDDLVAAELAAGAGRAEAGERAVERLGGAAAVTAAWAAQYARPHARQRARMLALVLAVALASVLAVAQHAQGGRDRKQQPTVCATPVASPAPRAAGACASPGEPASRPS